MCVCVPWVCTVRVGGCIVRVGDVCVVCTVCVCVCVQCTRCNSDAPHNPLHHEAVGRADVSPNATGHSHSGDGAGCQVDEDTAHAADLLVVTCAQGAVPTLRPAGWWPLCLVCAEAQGRPWGLISEHTQGEHGSGNPPLAGLLFDPRNRFPEEWLSPSLTQAAVTGQNAQQRLPFGSFHCCLNVGSVL